MGAAIIADWKEDKDEDKIMEEDTLCSTMACFERNLHNQISSGDSVQSTTFCGNHVVGTTFLFHDPL